MSFASSVSTPLCRTVSRSFSRLYLRAFIHITGGSLDYSRLISSSPSSHATETDVPGPSTDNTSQSTTGPSGSTRPRLIPDALPLEHFLANAASSSSSSASIEPHDPPPYLAQKLVPKKFFLEVYGCQMNGADADLLNRILTDAGYTLVPTAAEADIVLLVTCAIRDRAEQRIWSRLRDLQPLRARGGKVGLLGCMAERLKLRLLEGTVSEKTGKRTPRQVDVVCGPDAYRALPALLGQVAEEDEDGRGAADVQLSVDETYADITPLAVESGKKTANLTIMRGCNNMCSYCIVPFTRGRERSRPITSILDEVKHLRDLGIKEITLLGQNVNSYRDTSPSGTDFLLGRGASLSSPDFKPIYKFKTDGLHFTDLLDHVSRVDPEIRIRFISPHPQFFPPDLLHLIAERHNLCSQLHLPAQSGSSSVLERMRRGYTREAYLDLAHRARAIIPNVTLSSDFIVGFCGETEEEFLDTLSLAEEVGFELAFTFAYSLRERTRAHRHLQDGVPKDVKASRLARLNEVYERNRARRLEGMVAPGAALQLVLVTGEWTNAGKKYLTGRSDGFVRCALPADAVLPRWDAKRGIWVGGKMAEVGEYVIARPTRRHTGTLVCEPVGLCTVAEFGDQTAHPVAFRAMQQADRHLAALPVDTSNDPGSHSPSVTL